MSSPNGQVTHSALPPLRVVIIGAGFSGTMVAIHLLRGERPVELDIVDRRLAGRGLAYGTTYDQHLLNVPAVRMSAFGSEPMHFLHWLHTHGMPAAEPGNFAPRKVYGAYVQDLLQATLLETTLREAHSPSRLRHHYTEALSVTFDGLSAVVSLANGERLEADKVVLALGNPPSRSFGDGVPGYFHSPWQPAALAGLAPEKKVLLIGAGLTAVDAFLALTGQGHIGEIHIVSRRGKLPQSHQPYRPLTQPFPLPGNLSARNLLRAIRQAVKAAEARGVDWRAVIDSLRPVTNEVWQQLAPKEQARVFRHLKTWWDIHRHRMAPEIASKIREGFLSGQLKVHGGRLLKLIPADGAVQADLALRSGKSMTLQVDRVINCTGPESDHRASGSSLLGFLLDAGYAVPGATDKGLHTTAAGELIDANGRPLQWLLTVGPPRLGNLFETVAVPELRKQAETVANQLLAISREPEEIMAELFMAAGI